MWRRGLWRASLGVVLRVVASRVDRGARRDRAIVRMALDVFIRRIRSIIAASHNSIGTRSADSIKIREDDVALTLSSNKKRGVCERKQQQQQPHRQHFYVPLPR